MTAAALSIERALAGASAALERREGAALSAALWLAYFVLALLLYAPALSGQFVSDDFGYIVNNPYVTEPSFDRVLAILAPNGPVTESVANWAPVHVLLHALEYQLFANALLPYHVVNVALHALASVLLLRLLRDHGLPLLGALVGSLFFLLHPANVEAVAWISQLKTNAALCFALGALRLQLRLPWLAFVLFALAFLTKAVAACALPAAALFAWARGSGARRADALWLLAWLGFFVLASQPQFQAFERLGHAEERLAPDLDAHLRTIVAFGARYLAMATTSWGVSAFHDPARALSWLDPWWLAGLALGVLLAVRVVGTLQRREAEAGFWAFAAAAWVPIAQFFPFAYPLADRYLYFILPGLIGGVLLAGRALAARLPRLQPAALAGALAAAAVLLVVFAARVPARAAIWRSELHTIVDSANHYPNGVNGHFRRAWEAARAGNDGQVVRSLRAMRELGFDNFNGILLLMSSDPAMGRLRGQREFDAALAGIAGRWLENVGRRSDLTQPELRVKAHAHLVRGERALALDAFEAALAIGGPLDEVVRAELERTRRDPRANVVPGLPGR